MIPEQPTRNSNNNVPQPTPHENPQPVGDMWLFKRFRDCDPSTFNGNTDVIEAEG